MTEILLEILKLHIIAFMAGFLLDLLCGDPQNMPHPIRLIGCGVSWFEKCFLKKTASPGKQLWQGFIMVSGMFFLTGAAVAALLVAAYRLHPFLFVVVESIMTYQILALKCLRDESMKVYECLKNGTIEEARAAVAMIVGRDTNELSEAQVAKAAVETVAENCSDGVLAPMLYLTIGGPLFGFLYKAVNTMDSMVGYKNEKYLYFGRCAARLDDILNYIPARLCAVCMLLSCLVLGSDFSFQNACRIFWRDRYNHASPNSAQTEAVMAGALRVQLAGDASYFGKLVKKPYIGDSSRNIETEDIRRANRLSYTTAFLFFFLCLTGMLLYYFCYRGTLSL